MKKKHKFGLALVLMLVLALQMTVSAAGNMTIAQCAIVGDQVTVIATGTQAASDSGEYYLFALQPYEAGIGTRTDYCASAPAGTAVNFTTPLNYNTASSKLYCRFVVAALQGGQFVAISNESYITNPEAVATKALGQPARSQKGIIVDARYTNDLTDLNCGYACYILSVNKFFEGSGVSYTYNGKNYSFSSSQVAQYDLIVPAISNQGVNLIMVVMNGYSAATADMVPAAARVASGQIYSYGFNVQEQIPTEKLEALMSFLASRYNGTGHGTIHSWVVGNEVNNNMPAHYIGNMSVEQYAADYATQFRVIYNAVKSQNRDARVYTNIDQRWSFVDAANPLQYPSKTFIDLFASNIKSTGDIDWALSIHPHAIPMSNARFWTIPAPYSGLNLVNGSDNTKMATVQNMEVFVNHMKQAQMLSPAGTVRHIIITELGFSSTTTSEGYVSDQQTQAAAMVYAFKKFQSLPEIEAFIIHKHLDDAGEVAIGRSYGLKTISNTPKFAYNVFKTMDSNPSTCDFALPIIGVSSWQQLGLN